VGTENVISIVGLGKACEIAAQELNQNLPYIKAMRDRLQDGLSNSIHGIKINGHMENRLPNTLSISFKNNEADRILERIGLDIAASAGAACHSETIRISHVLDAMNVPITWAKGTIRFTTGRMTTVEEVDKAIAIIRDAVE